MQQCLKGERGMLKKALSLDVVTVCIVLTFSSPPPPAPPPLGWGVGGGCMGVRRCVGSRVLNPPPPPCIFRPPAKLYLCVVGEFSSNIKNIKEDHVLQFYAHLRYVPLVGIPVVFRLYVSCGVERTRKMKPYYFEASLVFLSCWVGTFRCSVVGFAFLVCSVCRCLWYSVGSYLMYFVVSDRYAAVFIFPGDPWTLLPGASCPICSFTWCQLSHMHCCLVPGVPYALWPGARCPICIFTWCQVSHMHFYLVPGDP